MVKSNIGSPKLRDEDSDFLAYLRSFSIFVIVFGHVGGFWVFRPYSELLHVFVPIFFFISGAVSLNSYNKSSNLIDYYLKRLAGLMIPYYLLCFLILFIYFQINSHLPTFNILNILRWIQINPPPTTMSFLVGQVWFLYTLFIIILASPLYFLIIQQNRIILVILMVVLVILSGMQLVFNINKFFNFIGNNLFLPLVHSSFYIFGILWISSNQIRNLKLMTILLVFCMVTSIFMLKLFKLNIDYAFHLFPPDLYYISGSFSAILIALILKDSFVRIVNKLIYLKNIFNFFYRHTFSIFLLHPFSIYLAETIFRLVNPVKKTIAYGIIKLIIVLIISCILAVPFSKISSLLIGFLFEKNKTNPA